MSNQTDEEGVVVFITALNDENASIIAKDFVESKLAACVNIVKNILSIYLWQSKVEDDFEVPMIVTTRRTQFKERSSRGKELYSYEVPEVIALPIEDEADDYL